MNKSENTRKEYKTMSPPDRRKQPAKKPSKPQRPPRNSGQILIILLLSVILIVLGILVFLFFQPEKVQLWQDQILPENRVERNSTPEVKRLTPREILPEREEQEAAVPAEAATGTDKPSEKAPEEADLKTRNARLFFVKVNTEGQISLKSLVRPVRFSTSPLTETINVLLKGPSSDEINKGSLTLIPEGSRLLSARVEAGTAYLNFNEAFRFNSLGREGYTAQLKQIVYTATEFSNIRDVQILIEGSRKEYLGGEGIYVGQPLSRETFQTAS